jgi:hypothetical protein
LEVVEVGAGGLVLVGEDFLEGVVEDEVVSGEELDGFDFVLRG